MDYIEVLTQDDEFFNLNSLDSSIINDLLNTPDATNGNCLIHLLGMRCIWFLVFGFWFLVFGFGFYACLWTEVNVKSF